MVKTLTIFAIMATMAIAAPTSSQNGYGLGTSAQVNADVSITATAGFSAGVAGGLEACWSGASSLWIDVEYKEELGIWIKGAGRKYFNAAICAEISEWCNGDYQLKARTRGAISAVLSLDAEISAKGGALLFLNAEVEKGYNGAGCACKSLDKGHQASLTAFLRGNINLDAAIRASLQLSAAGGVAATLSDEAAANLKLWLSSKDCSIKGDLLVAVNAWISVDGSADVSTGADVYAHGKVDAQIVVLSELYLQKLSSFCESSEFLGLDLQIQAGLKAGAAGGVAVSLDASIRAAITAWIESSECTLDASLKASIKLWLAAHVGVGAELESNQGSFEYISIGLDVSANFGLDGALNVHGQAALTSWCEKSGAGIDVDIFASLQSCAKGELAASLDISVAAKLSAWLASSDCHLDAELRASVMAWISVRQSVSGKAGVEVGAGAGNALNESDIVAISAGIKNSTELSVIVKGALGVCVAGGVAADIEFQSRAELSAFLCSEAGLSLGLDVQVQLMGWLSGFDKMNHYSS